MSERLPTVGPAAGTGESGDGGVDASSTPEGAAGGAIPGLRPPTSSFKLVLTLAIAGGVAGFFIVLVHLWSQPRIEAYQARVLGEAVQEVLGGPETTGTFYLHEGGFTPSPPPSADTAAMDRIYVGWDGAGAPVGIAAAAAEPGFQDVISLIFGFDPGKGEVLGMKVLESKETPGLGDKIIKDSAFVGEFQGVQAPLEGVKPARATGGENEVDMITGATISSQAVVDIINHRIAALEGPLQTLWSRGVPALGQVSGQVSGPASRRTSGSAAGGGS